MFRTVALRSLLVDVTKLPQKLHEVVESCQNKVTNKKMCTVKFSRVVDILNLGYNG